MRCQLLLTSAAKATPPMRQWGQSAQAVELGHVEERLPDELGVCFSSVVALGSRGVR